jgi:hypothetical protein
MNEIRCALCGQLMRREDNPCAPFCSRRCQELDLNRWLDERYGLPWEDPQEPTADDFNPAEPVPPLESEE